MKKKLIFLFFALLLFVFGFKHLVYFADFVFHYRPTITPDYNQMTKECGLYYEVVASALINGRDTSQSLYFKKQFIKSDTALIKDFAKCYFEKNTSVATIRICQIYYKYAEDRYTTPCIRVFSREMFSINKKN
jgi:hypothetical protein